MTKSRMRVAYILTPITFGGAEKVSLNFLRAVDRQRFNLDIIILVRPWEKELYFASELQRLGYRYQSVPVAVKTTGDPMRVPRVAYMLYNCLNKCGYSLVHTHGYFADICGQLAAFLLGIGGISTCHGFIETDFKLRMYNRMDKYALRLCKKVIAVSEEIKGDLLRHGIKSSRITVLPNAVSDSCGEDDRYSRRQEKRYLLGISPGEYVIGSLGRLSVEKGIVYLIEAVAELLDANVSVKLVIVGDGPTKTALEQQVKARGIANQVVFTGFVIDPENWYPAFDIFALPSLTEGTPLALLESMAVGVPVIASAVGGVPKVVTDGVDGLLVPPGNIQAMKEKLQLLISDPELSRRLGGAGMKSIKANYGIDRWCREIERCYRAVSQECQYSECATK